ncbi:hypothetical protein RUM44_010520 [Polyplax serrata]|uniref:Uncharacterized protein n=1 Tax=Polyplax serrata TaxID=468196 RepID=A0ABR1AW33_POLSC
MSRGVGDGDAGLFDEVLSWKYADYLQLHICEVVHEDWQNVIRAVMVGASKWLTGVEGDEKVKSSKTQVTPIFHNAKDERCTQKIIVLSVERVRGYVAKVGCPYHLDVRPGTSIPLRKSNRSALVQYSSHESSLLQVRKSTG